MCLRVRETHFTWGMCQRRHISLRRHSNKCSYVFPLTHIASGMSFPHLGTIPSDNYNCVPLPGIHISLVFFHPGNTFHQRSVFPYLGTHISRDMCSSTWETHIPSEMCFPYPGTHIPSDMCSPTVIPYDNYPYSTINTHTLLYISILSLFMQTYILQLRTSCTGVHMNINWCVVPYDLISCLFYPLYLFCTQLLAFKFYMRTQFSQFPIK